MNRALCILGPTAAGKTTLAAHVAARLNGEVLSVDSRQIYRGMDLGTGKDLDDYDVEGQQIAYHLIDIVDPGYEYNLFEFKCAAVDALRDIAAREKLPILCGGTGLYLSALIQDYALTSAPPNIERQLQLEQMTTEQLVERLKSFGPLHNRSDSSDRKRLIRAIEIAESDPTSRAPSSELNVTVFGLRWSRATLRHRISQRLRQRIEEGLIEEVERLLEGGLTAEQLIFYGLEYRYVTEHLMGKTSASEMVELLERAIQQFAKRQETWFRRMEKQGVKIQWLDATRGRESLIDQVLLAFGADE
jgi:tRNA dimethylallyltransferase